jgi:hypothetical protein
MENFLRLGQVKVFYDLPSSRIHHAVNICVVCYMQRVISDTVKWAIICYSLEMLAVDTGYGVANLLREITKFLAVHGA